MDTQGLEYRRALPADASILTDIRVAFIRIVKDSGIPGEDALRRDLEGMFSSALASGSMVAWLCLDGARVVATGAVGMGGSEGLVFNMYTDPAWRRRGIASELLRRCIADGRARGAGRFRLQPTDDGRPLYERFGFRASGADMVLDIGTSGGAGTEGQRQAGAGNRSGNGRRGGNPASR